MSVTPGPCRLILDDCPGDGAWNMRVDEALLESAVCMGRLSLRWYQWREPTVSLGYFQPADAVEGEPRLHGLPVVRRLSGGGAIVHDQEWTYSCALPAGHPLSLRPLELYRAIHEACVAALAEHRISARLRGDVAAGQVSPFLCFARGDRFDVMMGNHKVIGSAQRRRKGAVLQHGSLLLRRSAYAPEFPGILDLAGWHGDSLVIERSVIARIASKLSRIRQEGPLGDEEPGRITTR